MVGSEESVPAVQHARLAARPAGRQHRRTSADTAASARHREPGVAEAKPLVQHTTDTGTQHIRHSCSHLYRYTLVWVRGQTEGPGVNTQVLTNVWVSATPITSLICNGHKKDFLISALTDNQWTLCFFLFTNNEEKLIEKKSPRPRLWSIPFSQPKHFSGDTS